MVDDFKDTKTRQDILDEIRRKRAAAARSEGIIGAAERGEYGDVGQGDEKGPFDDEIIQDIMEYQAGDVSQLDLTKAQRQYGMLPKSSIDKFMRRGLGFLFRRSPLGLALTYGPEVVRSIKNLVMPADQMVTDTGMILNMADDTKRFPIQMGGPEQKLIKGVNDTAEDIFGEVDQKIIDNVDITTKIRGTDKVSRATPEKKKLTLKLLKIAESDKSNEAFGVKFRNAYKNYVLGEDATIPKGFFGKGGFSNYREVAQNILNYKNLDSSILDIPNPNTVRVSADGTKVTQMIGTTFELNPTEAFNKIKIGSLITGDQAKRRLKREIIVGNDTKNFREISDEITKKNKVVSSKLSTLKNLFEEGSGNVHVYAIDHIQAPRFGGANANKENLTFIMEGPHNNLKNLPASKTLADDVVKPKSRFEDEVYKKATGLVDAIANGNNKRAEEISKEIFDLQNNFKNTFKNVDFVVGEAFVPIKTGEKTANYVKYSDEVGLNDEQKKLVENLLPTYSNRPNQGVGVEKSIDRLIDAYSQMAILTPGGKISKGAAGQMYSGKDGGMVEISHLIRPL